MIVKRINDFQISINYFHAITDADSINRTISKCLRLHSYGFQCCVSNGGLANSIAWHSSIAFICLANRLDAECFPSMCPIERMSECIVILFYELLQRVSLISEANKAPESCCIHRKTPSRVSHLYFSARVQFHIAHFEPCVFIDQAEVLSGWSSEFCLCASCQSSFPLRLSSTRFSTRRLSNRLLM